MYFLPFKIFEQHALALKNRVCPENFQAIEYIFCHSGYLSSSALAMKNRVCPEFTVLNMLFTFRIFEQLALALKIEFALKFFKPAGADGPTPRIPMLISILPAA